MLRLLFVTGKVAVLKKKSTSRRSWRQNLAQGGASKASGTLG
jgi:glutathione synthase/RimK-type ligase-like ATP-grasp enzyme